MTDRSSLGPEQNSMTDEESKETQVIKTEPVEINLSNDNLSEDLNKLLQSRSLTDRKSARQRDTAQNDIYNVCDDVTKDLDKLHRDIDLIMVR